LADGFRESLLRTVNKVAELKVKLKSAGFSVAETEPLKIVINTAEYGYSGEEIMLYLRERNIEIEFFDGEIMVLMPSPFNTDEDFSALCEALLALPKCTPISVEKTEIPTSPVVKASVREAIFSSHELIPCRNAVGRICASPTVSCPPAVPIVVSGEVIQEEHVPIFEKYKVEKIEVVKNA
jgi:arginine/lysine/ornithine decarboxylase